MSEEHLRTGDKAIVRFRFIKTPEYLRPNMRMVFREGRTKAVGMVTKLYPHITLQAMNMRQPRGKKSADGHHQQRPQNEPQKPSKRNRRNRNAPYPSVSVGNVDGAVAESANSVTQTESLHSTDSNKLDTAKSLHSQT